MIYIPGNRDSRGILADGLKVGNLQWVHSVWEDVVEYPALIFPAVVVLESITVVAVKPR
jgi:hypothetical protein